MVAPILKDITVLSIRSLNHPSVKEQTGHTKGRSHQRLGTDTIAVCGASLRKVTLRQQRQLCRTVSSFGQDQDSGKGRIL